MVGPTGIVCGIDHIPELVQLSLTNTRMFMSTLPESKHLSRSGEKDIGVVSCSENYAPIIYRTGDGRLGWPEIKAPEMGSLFLKK
jgi:hypothetical protein